MVICYILGCKSRSERKSENITFHSFPKNREICQAWIRATGRQNWEPTKSTRICSKHFEQNWFKKTAKRTGLKKQAVPTLNIFQQSPLTSDDGDSEIDIPIATEKVERGMCEMDGSCFSAKEKIMIVNVYRNVKKTIDQSPCKTNLYEKTASMLGINVSSVTRILKEHESNGTCKFPTTPKPRVYLSDKIDKLTKSAIRKKVHSFYMNGKIPTMNKVLQAINEDDNFPNFKLTTFKNVLDNLKFQYVQRHTNYALIDKEEVIVTRVSYLKKMKEYRRQKRCIYYLDEMWFHPGNTPGSNKNANTKCLIVVHIGNERGFVKDGLCVFFTNTSPNTDDEIKAKEFENWFEKILPKLESNALVVMDDTPNHSRIQGRSPRIGWQKKNIQNWLSNIGVDYEEDNYKVELLSKVTEVLPEHQLYRIDEMAKRRNIEVLRLPPYHGDLNPMKFIWADIKTNVSKYNVIKADRLKILVEEAIEKFPVERWLSAIHEVVDLEDNFYSKIDALMDDAIDRYLSFSFNDSHSSGESTVTCNSSDSEAD